MRYVLATLQEEATSVLGGPYSQLQEAQKAYRWQIQGGADRTGIEILRATDQRGVVESMADGFKHKLVPGVLTPDAFERMVTEMWGPISELTDVGEQYVMPGCERDELEVGEQGSLF